MVDVEKFFGDCKAWAYGVFYESVKIGYWDGKELHFHELQFDEAELQELRVFDSKRELRYVRLPDDSLAERFINDSNKQIMESLRISANDVNDLCYAVYGENEQINANDVEDLKPDNYGENAPTFVGGWSMRCEKRGGKLWIPAKLTGTNLYLKVRNYFKWNNIKIGKKDADDSDIRPNLGALEFLDHRFVGFFDDNEGEKEVVIHALQTK